MFGVTGGEDPIENVFEAGSSVETLPIAPAAGSYSSTMVVIILRVGQEGNLITFSDLEAGFRDVMEKVRVNRQEAFTAFIEGTGVGKIGNITTYTIGENR